MKWTIPIFIASLSASAILYPFYHDARGLAWFGNALQIAGLIIATLNLNLARNLYKPGDEPRDAWAWLTAGMILWVIGQVFDAYCEMILREVPYGTIADAFWVIGYIPLLLGLTVFIRNFRSTGLPAGSHLGYVGISVLFIVLYVIFLVLLVFPELNDPEQRFAEKFLDFAYPALDLTLLAMATILLRISWTLRGGNLAKVWLFLCAGFAMVAAADLVLGRITDVSSDSYRYLDILYFSAYFCIAVAGRIQGRILTSS